MKVIRNIHNLKFKKSIVALGTFDGVHLGHKRVILYAKKLAKQKLLPLVIVTFEPHPANIVRNRNISLLTTIEERAYFASCLDVDYMVVIKFTKGFANLNYKNFVEKYIVKLFNADSVFVGKDYCFGKNKEGNVAKLKKLGQKFGFSTFGIKDKIEHKKIVKSTLIRSLLRNGSFAHAIKLLGHYYLIKGKVVKGKGIGQKIGFPTANLQVDKNKLLPRNGVYCGCVCVKGKTYNAVINIGRRPTFGFKKVVVEAHLINFHKNIFGKKISVFLVERLRNEKRFDCVGDLVMTIKKDISIASKKFLSLNPTKKS